MILCAYLGSTDSLPAWQEKVRHHADWLALPVSLGRRDFADGRCFAFGWLTPAGSRDPVRFIEAGGSLALPASGEPGGVEALPRLEGADFSPTPGESSNTVWLVLTPPSGELRVRIPPATPEQFYYAPDEGGYLLGNDLRFLMRCAGAELDERAVYALLQYGAIPPTFTFSNRVHRVPNGHTLFLPPPPAEPRLERHFRLSARKRVPGDPSDPVGPFLDVLDGIVGEAPRGAVLYFSGGVDSGLLASRLSRKGRRDIRLVNLSFGKGDPESELASRMAAHLGMACEVVTFDPAGLPGMLSRLGRDYSFPFCDLSTIPTYFLVRGSLPLAEESRTVLEGTGADGEFGIGTRLPFWRGLYRLPRPFRWCASAAYRGLNLWKHDPRSWLEKLGRISRRSVQMPLEHAALLAVNSLEGIAYRMEAEVREVLEGAIRHRIEALSEGLGAQDRFSFLDLVHVCAGIYAAKSFDPLRVRGIRALYPFLEPSALEASFAIPWEEKCRGGEPKRILKEALAHHVPRDMVFRPKSGFLPPFDRILAHPALQEFLRSEVLPEESPLRNFFEKKTLEQMIRRGSRGLPLSRGAYNLIWGLAFASGWFRQVKAAHS